LSKRLKLLPALAVAGVCFAATAALAETTPANTSSCFKFGEFQNWKSPAPNVLLIKVGANRVFRLDLRQGSDQLKYSDTRIINRNMQSTWICGPLDFSLVATDAQGTWHEPLIVNSMRQLTPDEIAAVPPQDRP
jgi:hypothetical protein